MQKAQEAAGGTLQNGKRRRLQGSCDSCKKKKVRCDSAEMPDNRCFPVQNEFRKLTVIKGISSSTPSAQTLKTAQEHVATILSTSTIYVPSHDPVVSHRILVEVAGYARSLENRLAALQPQTLVPITTSATENSTMEDSPSPGTSELTSQGSIDSDLPIQDALRGLTPFGTNKTDRFYGQSSSVQFIKAVMKHIHGDASHLVGVQRPEFWNTQPWEMLTIEAPHQIFPENDLLKALIKIYFEQINPIVRPLRATFSPEPSLYQLQLICLSIMYMSGTSNPEENWILASLGIRFAQGAGAHHRRGYSHMDPLTAELYKRVFWVLVMADTIMSSFKGRPSISKPTEFDLELPLDCDDEYWGKPNPVQPSWKPSSAAFLPCYVRLVLTFGRIQGAVYPVNGQICSKDVIVQLDSALNKWVDIIPEHLKWDPHQRNQIFLDQSAALYATYYHAQILIHRPFIPAPGRQPVSNVDIIPFVGTDTYSRQTPFPSIEICANAARCCGHVLDVQARRGRGLLSHPNVMTALFDCAVVLLVNVWGVVGGPKSRTPDDFTRATADAQNCVRVLRLYERRWRLAGRKCDIISAMLNIGKYTSDAQSLKRPRDTLEDPLYPAASEGFHHSPQGSIAGSSMPEMLAPGRSIQETGHLSSLPLLSEELGRLPAYDSFDYAPTFQHNEIHYRPQSHLDSEHDTSGSEHELLSGVDCAIGSTSSSPTQQRPRIHMAGDQNIQLPSLSFYIPISYGPTVDEIGATTSQTSRG
ncbi:Fungal-trans domain-containing protein [Mycena venus]|uniref:Fungal-trans domain-containing protein n=1 Tax=Mycena venus TaxID=2733690 RepID=A0A8H6XVN1_9AGAR|nr:Fungal-trans domain-containing protein [Mycena venus]